MNYIPDRWVILNTYNEDGTLAANKVFASWYGGFAGSDYWQLNSNIVDVKDIEGHYEFTSQSGNIYICYKQAYGMSRCMQTELEHWQAKVGEHRIKIDERYVCKKQHLFSTKVSLF